MEENKTSHAMRAKNLGYFEQKPVHKDLGREAAENSGNLKISAVFFSESEFITHPEFFLKGV